MRNLLKEKVELRVQPLVAYYEIQISISIEVSGDDLVPPARGWEFDILTGCVLQFSMPVDKYFYGHPFPHHDKVGLVITIEVDPYRIRHHTDILQGRAYLRRRIREMAFAVIEADDDVGRGGSGIGEFRRNGIGNAIAVDVSRGNHAKA